MTVSLSEQISRCLLLRKLTTTKIPFNPTTPRPKAFDSVEEAEAFRNKYQLEYKDLHDARENQKVQVEELKQLEKDIVRQIPVKNSWIRVQIDDREMAIGYKTDAWGGDHIALAIQPWREDLYDLVDTLHYR